MKKPRALTSLAIARALRSQRTPTRLFQLVPGAVLLSALSLTQVHAWRVQLRGYSGLLVKNVRISLFNLVFTQVFTLFPLKVLNEKNIRNRNLESSGGKTTKTGGSDPTFSAFSRPKSFVGSLPPVFSTTRILKNRTSTTRTPALSPE